MQRIHVKKVSYPFDWIWTDDTIIVDMIEDDFAKLLDKSYYVEPVHKFSERMCGHTYYHEDLFFHKDPRNEEDHQYYHRCVDRFKEMVKSPEEKLFIMMFSPFVTKYPIDLHEMIERGDDKSLIIERMKQKGRNVMNALEKITNNHKLCVVMNFGDNERQTFKMEHEGRIDFLELNTLSHSNGVTFIDNADNLYFSGLMCEHYRRWYSIILFVYL